MAEHYLRLAALKGIATATALRVGNAYGAFLPSHRLQGLIGVTMNNIRNGRPARVFGRSTNVRDYIHIDDIASCCTKVLRPRSPFEIYKVGTGMGHSVVEVLDTISACMDVSFEREEILDMREAVWLQPWIVLDIAKAWDELKWRPHINLQTGIARLASHACHASA
jgi:UDP-glucose 4-epimerase